MPEPSNLLPLKWSENVPFLGSFTKCMFSFLSLRSQRTPARIWDIDIIRKSRMTWHRRNPIIETVLCQATFRKVGYSIAFLCIRKDNGLS